MTNMAEPSPAGVASLRMPYDEYLGWLDEDKHAEWVNGEVTVYAPRKPRLGRLILTAGRQ